MKKYKIIGIILISLGILIPTIYFSSNKIKEKTNEKLIIEKIAKNDYFAIIEIPKINLKKELYEIGDQRNNVDKNILVHKNSIFPKNIILASHSGNRKYAYFKNLYKLKVNEPVKIYYNNQIYEYIVEEIEEQNKTGNLYLKEDLNERLILITCSKNNKTQVIYYCKLKSISDI